MDLPHPAAEPGDTQRIRIKSLHVIADGAQDTSRPPARYRLEPSDSSTRITPTRPVSHSQPQRPRDTCSHYQTCLSPLATSNPQCADRRDEPGSLLGNRRSLGAAAAAGAKAALPLADFEGHLLFCEPAVCASQRREC